MSPWEAARLLLSRPSLKVCLFVMFRKPYPHASNPPYHRFTSSVFEGRALDHANDSENMPIRLRLLVRNQAGFWALGVCAKPGGALIRGNAMPKAMLATVASLTLLWAGTALAPNANATTLTGAEALPNAVQGSSPIQTVACWCGPYRCACGHVWRRGYWSRPYPYYRRHPYWGRPYRRCWWRAGVKVCR